MLCIVLLNETPADHSALAAQITPEWLASAAAALQTQLTRDIAPSWPYAVGAVVRVGSGPEDVGATEVPFRILPTLPDAPGAIAYHDDASGYPDEFIGLDTCDTLDEVSSAMSHENAEVCGDPNCDQWTTMPTGMQVATEVCDPLQDRSYAIDGIAVSDFCLPAYFWPAPGPTSYGEAQGGPRLEPFARTPGGYQLVRNADGSGETQVFGVIPDHKMMRAKNPGSRLYRRGIRS